MSISLGIDVGAVSVKLAALGTSDDEQALTRVTEKNGIFFSPQLPLRNGLGQAAIVLSTYRRLQGNPQHTTFDLLREFYAAVPRDSVTAIRITGSGGRTMARALGAQFENEFRALACGTRALYPQVRTVFEMGGETSKYIRLGEADDSEHLGILDYQSSTECAAGTGSFIDQQASRLLFDVDDVGEAACGAACAARVAGRCSVFAKSDMIHAQQRGYPADQILRGLCEAVARNFKSSIVKGRKVVAPVAFVGGVALNAGVREAIRHVFKLQESEFFIPEAPCWLTALGAGILARESRCKKSSINLSSLEERSAAEGFPTTDALSLDGVVLLRDRIKARAIEPGTRVDAYLGIDVGSVSTNLVVIDAAGNLYQEIYVPTAGRPIEVVTAGLREIEEELGTRIRVRGVGTTGSGRELIGELTGADVVKDEITAHKTGAMRVCEQVGMESVDTIFEIGGQDSKFIRIQDGVVIDFTMNEACAAGTGSFLEEQAEKLGIAIKGEFAQLALSSKSPVRLGERCTVFMARDVSSLLLKGAAVPDLCAGLAYSVALNYLNRVVRGRKIGEVIYFQGGTAYNDSVAAAFSVILRKRIVVPPFNGVIGAIGAALLARDRMQHTKAPSRFRGFDLTRVKFTGRDFVCRACANDCEMKEFLIDGEKTYWGDQCSDKFRKRARTDRQPVIDDLFTWRDQVLQAVLEPPQAGRKTVGIPRAMFFFDRFPFWCTYLQELGYNVALSPPTDGRTAAEGEELAIAQPCFPIQVAHGHVQALLNQNVDYILLPNTVNAETPFMDKQSKLCPWNVTLPFVVRAIEKLEPRLNGNLLMPTVHFREGIRRVREEMRLLAAKLGRSKICSDTALELAYFAQKEFDSQVRRAGDVAWQKLRITGEPAIVLLGRPYNMYDRSACCDIPRKLRALYGINVLPMDLLPLDEEEISSVNGNMYWHSGRRILAAAQLTRGLASMHLIYISNFKCGPDSYLKSFIEDASGKPSLVLQFDGHSNDAGYVTRCEAYLDSTGFLR
ncbi:MAG TPA: acyl-CoA dehydratase activase [Terriglobales bacterium]